MTTPINPAWRLGPYAAAFFTLFVAASPVCAQEASAPSSVGLWDLFKQSFDFFTVLLIFGSLVGMTVVFVCFIEIRESRILPSAVVRRVKELASTSRIEDLRDFVLIDGSYLSNAIRPALVHAGGDKTALREAAELAASEESARWFRKIEILNVIGNLGPLIGLAGTVWGMILAFTSLGEAGGQSQAANLSLGISKALFHTLLGLCLAIPCLLVFGIYRSIVDRICTRGMMLASEIVEQLPTRESR
jgi:biopolymer transport protein ExbB